MKGNSMTAVAEHTEMFTIDVNLLRDVIQKQACSLDKAVLEGVMNSIEAGATRVDVNLKIGKNDGDKHILSIYDDGKGIETDKEVRLNFGRFGTPHTEAEKKAGIWKRYRMGRGQMFNFGLNTWRTATNKMVVDIYNRKKLAYQWIRDLEYQKGCKVDIELYNHPGSVSKMKELVTRQVRYVEIPVYFNGEQVNTPASKQDWDYEDENAYYLFNAGLKLEIYNLGVFVKEYDDGIYGVVVSKKRLDVNFARNDIDSTCPIYIYITEMIKANRIKKVKKSGKKRRRLTDSERRATLRDLRDDEQSYDDVKSLPLIKTIQGKYISLNKMSKNRLTWCFAESGDRYGDKEMQHGRLLCLDEEILYFLGYPKTKKPKDFFSWLVKKDEYEIRDYGWGEHKVHRLYSEIRQRFETLTKFYVDYNDLKGGRADFYNVLPSTKLHKREKIILKVLKRMSWYCDREVHIGMSNSAGMWTDGESYIVIDRSYLKGFNLNSDIGVIRFLMDIAHEITHDTNTAGTHVHGPHFYEAQVELMGSNKSPLLLFGRFKESMRVCERELEQEKHEEKRKQAREEIKQKLSKNKGKKRGRKRQVVTV